MRGQATDKGLEHIRGMEHLESVCLQSAWGITDTGIAHLATLPKLTRFCTNSAEQLTDESLRHFGGVKTLEDVMIDGARFSDVGLKHLQGMKQLKNLGLVSYEALITDEGLSAFAKHTELESLSLENTLITDVGLKHLHGLKNLTELELSRSAVTPAGLASLRKVLPKLKSAPQGTSGGPWRAKKPTAANPPEPNPFK